LQKRLAKKTEKTLKKQKKVLEFKKIILLLQRFKKQKRTR